jgi:glycosyltransferase involved in cell wall biosynthesis
MIAKARGRYSPRVTVRVLLMLSADLEAEASGGIRTYVRDFVKYAPSDIEVSIVGSTADPRRRPTGRWREISYGSRTVRFLPIVHIPPDGRSRIPDLLRYVAAMVLRRRQLPLVDHNLQFHRPAIALAFLRHRGPMVQWLHLNPVEFAAHMKWRRAPGLLGRIEALTIRRMDFVVTPGTKVAELYRRRFPTMADRIRFSPNWYDADRFFVPTPEQREAARARVGEVVGRPLPADERLILFVGRINAQKDPLLLVDAFAAVAARRPEVRLLMIGAGSMRGQVEERAISAGLGERVHLIGSRSPEEVAACMHAADLLLMSSHTEVSARVTLEALGAGLPVVSTPAGEMERVVQHGVTGWIVRERHPAAFREGVEWALAQPRQEIAAATAASVGDYIPQKALASVYEMHRELAARALPVASSPAR